MSGHVGDRFQQKKKTLRHSCHASPWGNLLAVSEFLNGKENASTGPLCWCEGALDQTQLMCCTAAGEFKYAKRGSGTAGGSALCIGMRAAICADWSSCAAQEHGR